MTVFFRYIKFDSKPSGAAAEKGYLKLYFNLNLN
jgi:hypothetical protein